MTYSVWVLITLATCSGVWCSTPPWRRKPHGAPPDNVIITSSATIVLLSMSFFSFSSFSWLFSTLLWFLYFVWGALSMLAPYSAVRAPSKSSDVLFFLPHCPDADFSVSPALRPMLTPEHNHMHTHFCAPTHTQSGPTIIAKAEGEGEREIWWEGGVWVCLQWGMPTPNERGEGPTQHLSCHSDLCHWVADSPSKNRAPPPPPPLCLLVCSPRES